jgi:Ca2+-binding RTX toxin-like protein
MATLSTSVALDMDDWNLGNPLDGSLGAHNSHHFIYKDAGRAFNFGGSDIAYLNFLVPLPLGGTVRSLNIADGGSNVFSLTGFSIGVPELMTALAASQFDVLLPTVLAGKDTITGSAHADILDGFSGADTIDGAGGNDTLRGGVDADTLTGGTGADSFAYASALESTSTLHDTIVDFNAGQDTFVFDSAVTLVDGAIADGRLGRHFDADLANAADDAHLGAHHAVLFTPSTGKYAGQTYLVVDLNGDAGYQVGQDAVIQFTDTTHLAGLSAANFLAG